MAKYQKKIQQDPELKSLLESLPQAEGERYTWRTRVEREGVPGMRFFGEEQSKEDLPPEEMPKYVARIRAENPDITDVYLYLHRVGSKEPVKDPATGTSICLKYPAPPKTLSAPIARIGGALDPDLAQKEADLQREKQENRIREEKIRVDAQKKRLDDMEAGKTSAAVGGVDPRWPFGPGIPYKVVQVAPGVFEPVMLGDEEEEGHFRRFGRDREPRGLSFQEQLSLQREQAAAAERLEMLRLMHAPKEDASLKILMALIPALTGQQMKLPELMALMDTMTKSQQGAMKHALENNGEIMKMVAEHALDSGAPSDVIDQARRIVDVATDGFGKFVKQTTGRESLLNPDKPKALPPPQGKPQPSQLAARKPQPPPATIDAGQQIQAPTPQAALPEPPSPAEQAKAEGARRCTRLLDLHEREMRVESDPAVFFEDETDAKQIVEFVMGLPKAVRAAIDKADPKEIYEAFRVYVPERVDTLFALMNDPAKGKEYADWARQFWAEVKAEMTPEGEDEPVEDRRAAE